MKPSFPGGLKQKVFAGITLGFPLIVLAILEIALRLISYGPDLSLLTTEQIGGTQYSIMNHDVKHRYFTHVEFSPTTSFDYFQSPKPKGVFRIVCLGGSTTVGFPYGFAGSFPMFLKDRLHSYFPDRKIDVINFGMTATNSFTTLDIARELELYEPDLFIVYDGHNEFYGALGIASHESMGSSRILTMMYLRLIHWKTFLALRDLFFLVGNAFEKRPEEGTMMRRLASGQYIRFGDERYENALDIFRTNLRDLASLCMSRRIPLFLGTQVSNLKDLAPFVSDGLIRLNGTQRESYDAAMQTGKDLMAEGRNDSAIASFLRALQHDSLDAEAHYRIAQCLEAKGRNRDALRQFVLARDFDMLRFRTSSDFNAAIMNLQDGRNIWSVDMECAFAEHSPDSLIGNTLILEHLHPSLRGNLLIAHAFCDAMRRAGIPFPDSVWGKGDTLSDELLYERRPVTVVDERAAALRIDKLLSGWPFPPRAPQRFVPGNGLENAIARLVNGDITWEQAHVAAAEYHESIGDLHAAETEYQAIIRVIRVNPSPYLRLAQLYLNEGKKKEAAEILLQSLTYERTAFAYRALGAIAIEWGEGDKAVEYLQQAMGLGTTQEMRSDTGYLLALAHSRAGRREDAIRELRTVLQKDPQYRKAAQLLRRLDVTQ